MTDGSLAEGIDHAARVILRAGRTVAMTGAGLSVESGIPPFRGPGGLWTKHGEPPLDGYQRFVEDPAAAWRKQLNPEGFMRELIETLQRAKPNPGHFALAELEQLGLLHCLITQNVDDLHRQAGSLAVAEIHGNFTLTRCIGCGARRRLAEIHPADLPPRCGDCGGILKSDTVSFGEPIPGDVLAQCVDATEGCDCMLVVGTSATVYPAAQFPITVRRTGGELIELNPHESEITRMCSISIRAPAGETLPAVVTRVKEMLAAQPPGPAAT